MNHAYTKNALTLWILEVLCLFLVGSCAGQLYHTPDIFSNDSDLTAVKDNKINPRVYKADPSDINSLYKDAKQYSNPEEAKKAKNARNLLQSRMLSLSDRVTEEHLSSIFATEDASNVGLGIATVALSSIGTAVASASAKTGLSAAASISEGSRSIINEEVFSNAFAPAISKAIRATRKAESLRLEIKRRDKSIEEYTVEDAIHDVVIYHQMGSFYHGLELVQKATHRIIVEIDQEVKLLENKVNPGADLSYSSDENAAMRLELNKLLEMKLEPPQKKRDADGEYSTEEYAGVLAQQIEPGSTVLSIRLTGGEPLRKLIDELKPLVK